MMRATKGGQKGVREAGAQRRKTVMRRRMAERIQENPGFGGWSPVGITIVRTRQMASSGKGHSEGGEHGEMIKFQQIILVVFPY